MENPKPDSPFRAPGNPGGGHDYIVHFRLPEPEYRTLVDLARYHGTTVARLISGALPLVIERYRVLRALRVPPGARIAWRRRGSPRP